MQALPVQIWSEQDIIDNGSYHRPTGTQGQPPPSDIFYPKLPLVRIKPYHRLTLEAPIKRLKQAGVEVPDVRLSGASR